jgi:cytoskeleton protein RodZ
MMESAESGQFSATSQASAQVDFSSTVGQCLSAARKARGLSVSDVAQAIKFSPLQIEAIENDDFEKLPGTTIVRGFVRSYGRLLHLDQAMLVKLLDKQAPVNVATMTLPDDVGAAMPQQGGRIGINRKLAWIVAVVMLVGVVLLVVERFGSDSVTTPAAKIDHAAVTSGHVEVQQVAVAPAVGIELPRQTDDDAVTSGMVGGMDAVAHNPQQLIGQGDISGTASVSAMSDAQQLIFIFGDRSWVEVKDASQRIIFAQLNLPGSRQVVAGKPPFDLVIGNASHVQLLYEDRQIDLQPYTKVDVARFVLE